MFASLRDTALACSLRGLYASAEWLSGVAVPEPTGAAVNSSAKLGDVLDCPTLQAIALFNSKQFALAAFVLQEARLLSPIALFIRFYSLLMDAELKRKQKEREMCLKELLANLDETKDMDGFLLYLHALVCLRLKDKDRAYGLLIESVLQQPLLHCAWEELVGAMSSYDKFQQTQTLLAPISRANPCLNYFLFQTAKHLCPLADAQQHLAALRAGTRAGYTGTLLLEASMYYHHQDHPRAVELFGAVYEAVPALLDLCDEYANALYVVEDGPRLSWLAHRCDAVDSYRAETCVAVANYYSIRREHEKAIAYLRRAVSLDSGSSLAWTLIGHEFLEMKNQVAAIQVYRKAVDINDRDFRAWYALGNIYQMLKMPLYALYYFQKATALKPYDSRFWCGVASCHEDLKNFAEALRCYRRALAVDEAQQRGSGGALVRVARLYAEMDVMGRTMASAAETGLLDSVSNEARAASLYYQEVFVNREMAEETGNGLDVKEAAEYLVNHAIKTKNFANIEDCLDFLSAFDDARALVRECKAMMQ